MGKNFTRILLPLLLIGNLANAQSTTVVPSTYQSVDAGGSFTGPIASTGRGYQMLMDASLLTSMIGSDITGLTFRSSTSNATTWPTSAAAFNNFDIFMGPAVAITSATNTFAANEAGPQTQVRSGSWMIPAAAFPAGGTSSWGAVANFTTPYSYAGGNLAIRISHDGNSGGSRAVNAAGTATAGYNTLYKAAWSSGYGSTGGTQGNFAIIQLTYSSPLAVNLVSFEGSTKGEDVQLIWSTASEKNADRFVVQRSQDGSRFDGIDAVSAQAFAEGNKIYEYTDIAAFSKSGSLYYRLQIVDKDGSFKYSRVLKMTKEGLQKGCLTMAPNTVQAATNISFSLSMPATVSYQVLDMNGRSLLQDQVTGSKGNNSLLADFSELPAGNYVLHMNCAEFKDAIRFVKQ